MFAYNTSQQDSTKFTPFELMFGQKATLPIDINIQKKSKKLISGINFEDIETLNKEREASASSKSKYCYCAEKAKGTLRQENSKATVLQGRSTSIS